MAEPLESISPRMIAQNSFNTGGESRRDARNMRALPDAAAARDAGEGVFGRAFEKRADNTDSARNSRQAVGRGSGQVAEQAAEQGSDSQGGNASAQTVADSLSLSPEAQRQLRELQQRDAEVRSHEQSHISAGGPHVTGGASYSYQKGPDGRQYAIGGSVSIDTSSVPGDPEASKEKAQMVRRAALAPGEPSAQDQQVASKAASMEAQAAREAREEKTEEGEGPEGVAGAKSTTGAAGLENAGRLGASGAADGIAAGAAPASAAAAGIASLAQKREDDPYEIMLRRKAAGAYADMSLQGVMPTALAPGGTGLSVQV